MKNEFGFIFISGVRHAIPLIVPICYHRVIFNCDICLVFVWHFQHNLPGDIRRCESKKLGIRAPFINGKCDFGTRLSLYSKMENMLPVYKRGVPVCTRG